MFHKKNIDYVYLLWEDLLFQIENKDAKKTNKMSYPRFTKIIIDYFMSKDQSISRRNKMFWHTARDDTMFTSMRCISRYEDTQVYGAILPKELTNQAMLESNAYKTYYAFAYGEKAPKPKYVRKKADPASSPKQKPVQATKSTRLKLASSRSLFKLLKLSTYKGSGTKPGVPDVPIYESKSEKESWGDSEDEDEDDENDSDDISDEGDDDNDGNDDDDDDANDDDKQEGDDPNDDDEETDSDRTDYSLSSDFTSKNLNLENPSLADNEITSLMETLARHATTVSKNTSGFTTTIPLPPPFFNPLQQEATPTPSPTTLETTTSLPALLDFASVFKFNERVFNLENDVSKIKHSVFNLEKDLSEIKQVDQYAQALSSIPAIVDRYMDNKLREAINKAILAHNLDCRQEAQDEKNAYIELAVSDFANPVIEKNVTESVEAAVLTRSSSQPTSTYEEATSLFEFELTKILIDKMEKNKSYDKADYKKKLYDALVESYNTDKDLFDSYGEVFSLKRSRDDSDKDRDPSAGSEI
ncbi:hypothetical protein Tco_0630291, partial [Tanacetum coccineum]